MSSNSPSQDRRAVRSRQWMLEALLALVEEKDYASITIAEITDRAGVSRPTFYLHYKTKDEILLSYLDTVFEQFYSEIDPLLVGEAIPAPVGVQLFTQVRAHAVLFQLLSQAGADFLLVERFQRYTLRVFQRFLEKNLHRLMEPRLLDFVANYLSGASWVMLRRWLVSGLQPAPEVMGELYCALIQPGLTNVLAHGTLDELMASAY